MGKVVVTAFVTLDGVIQSPGFPDEDREGGFEHGGWMVPYIDDLVNETTAAMVLRSDALLLGRKTYERFSSHWPTADPADPRTARLNSQPKYVASRTLSVADWNNTTVLTGDIADEVNSLKEQYEELSIWGSTEIITQLLRHELIDEFVLMTFPLVVGGGKRLFGEGTYLSLTLAGSEVSSTGVVVSTYRRAPSD